MIGPILPKRSPDQIRDDAMRVFRQQAPAKYDEGQARQEVTSNLDDHPDLGQAIREELMDAWFYNESRERQIDELRLRVDNLERMVEYYKELSRR